MTPIVETFQRLKDGEPLRPVDWDRLQVIGRCAVSIGHDRAPTKELRESAYKITHRKCTCWLSLNTGPHGECEVCSGVPDTRERLEAKP